MRQQLVALSVVLTLFGAIAAQAFAQPNPNQLVANRKGAMNLQGKYFGPLLAMGLGRAPFDAKLAQRNAEYLANLTQMPWDDFQELTVGAKNTRAKDDIYKDPGKFKEGIERLQAEVQKLSVAARSGDQNTLKAAAQSVGRACNSCHESFATFDWRFKGVD
jgi:cytochrome c556